MQSSSRCHRGRAIKRLPTTGVAREAVGVIQAPHCLTRLPCSIDAKPTLDANAYGQERQERAVVSTMTVGLERHGSDSQS